MNDLTKLAKDARKREDKKKHIPKVKKCSYTGCPLNAATEVNGRYACNFHFDGAFHQDVTSAIRNRPTSGPLSGNCPPSTEGGSQKW